MRTKVSGSKPTRARTKKRIGILSDLFIAEIAGMRFQFNEERRRDDYFWKLLPGREVKIRREPKNPKDPSACAVFLNRKRLGYLPALVARKLAKKLDRGIQFRFYIFDLAHYYHCYQGLPSTSLLGIRVDQNASQGVR